MKALALLFVALVTSSSHAQTGFIDRSITVGSASYRYQVYVPLEYAPSKSWPVIVSLHGGGRQGTDGMQQTSTDFGIRVRNNRASFPCIVVFPQAQPNTRFGDVEMADLVMAELRRTITEFHGDTTRLYLHGNSMGGEGAYRIAFRWPQTFAAMIVVVGQVQLTEGYPQPLIDVDQKSNVFARAADPYTALATGIKHIPIWLFHGDADEVIPVEQSRKLAAALKSAGGNVRYTEFPGANHNGAAPLALANAELFPWLFAQHR